MSEEPNNQNSAESCVEFRMYYWDEEGSWNDVHCESYNDWMCQIRAGRLHSFVLDWHFRFAVNTLNL